MANRSSATSIDEYTAEFPPETQKVLQELRTLIKACAPEATETISWAMPTFDLNGKHLVHFAGYAHHVGLYPGASGITAFQDGLKPYKSAKGSVQFPLGQPLPTDLIRRIVAYRVKEESMKVSKPAASGSRQKAVRVDEPAGNLPGDDLPADLASPARRALADAGYSRLEQLTRVRESDLLELHGMGPKAIGQLRTALAGRGQSFAGEPER